MKMYKINCQTEFSTLASVSGGSDANVIELRFFRCSLSIDFDITYCSAMASACDPGDSFLVRGISDGAATSIVMVRLLRFKGKVEVSHFFDSNF